jgi:4-diphosphocytidyl-2-C-methyl-D-erythritol kinase
MSVRVFAPAKVNLTLEVGPAGADGRHPLRSLIVFADAGDWVRAADGNELSLVVTGPFAGALAGEGDNLVLRAARALDAAAGSTGRGAALSLEKNLSVASGLGGGSSDAGAALKALNQLWGLGFDAARLSEIAAGLGADAPACVAACSGLMRGTGEIFEPAPAPEFDAVLVNPGMAVSTAEVYRRFDALGVGAGFVEERVLTWSDVGAVGNDLEAPALAVAPEIAAARDALRRRGGVTHVGLSGSGATWFALMDSAASALALADDLARAFPTWWVRAVKLGGA